MFTGSLRSNLDPFHEHDDATLWKVLHEVNHLFVCVNCIFIIRFTCPMHWATSKRDSKLRCGKEVS